MVSGRILEAWVEYKGRRYRPHSIITVNKGDSILFYAHIGGYGTGCEISKLSVYDLASSKELAHQYIHLCAGTVYKFEIPYKVTKNMKPRLILYVGGKIEDYTSIWNINVKTTTVEPAKPEVKEAYISYKGRKYPAGSSINVNMGDNVDIVAVVVGKGDVDGVGRVDFVINDRVYESKIINPLVCGKVYNATYTYTVNKPSTVSIRLYYMKNGQWILYKVVGC